MGCSVSAAIITIEQKDQTAQERGFTETQKYLLQKSWKYMSNDISKRGSQVFMYIFKQYPEVKELFPLLRGVEGEDLLKNANFKGHAARFMQVVGAVVDNLESPIDELSPLLLVLGRNHIHYMGFKPEYFNVFTEAMMYIWSQELGSKFTDEVSAAWQLVFDFIMGTLQDGYMQAMLENNARDEF